MAIENLKLHDQPLITSVPDDYRVAFGNSSIKTGCNNITFLVLYSLINDIVINGIYGNGLQIDDSEYLYFAASQTDDTVNDVRISNDSDFFLVESCTVASGTKGGGTWVPVFPSKLTENYGIIGDGADKPVEIFVNDVISATGTLISGQCTLIDSRINSTSIVLLTPSITGTLTGTLKYDNSTSGRSVITSRNASNAIVSTDTVTFSYLIYL